MRGAVNGAGFMARANEIRARSIPDSRFPIPDSRFPISDYWVAYPHSRRRLTAYWPYSPWP